MARGGGFGNMQQLMQQAQRMQAEMEKKKEQLEQQTVTASSGGGMVTVTANGAQKVLAITIDPAAVDPDDVEMLEDLVLAAVSSALEQAQAMIDKEMGAMMGGLNLPGMP